MFIHDVQGVFFFILLLAFCFWATFKIKSVLNTEQNVKPIKKKWKQSLAGGCQTSCILRAQFIFVLYNKYILYSHNFCVKREFWCHVTSFLAVLFFFLVCLSQLMDSARTAMALRGSERMMDSELKRGESRDASA